MPSTETLTIVSAKQSGVAKMNGWLALRGDSYFEFLDLGLDDFTSQFISRPRRQFWGEVLKYFYVCIFRVSVFARVLKHTNSSGNDFALHRKLPQSLLFIQSVTKFWQLDNARFVEILSWRPLALGSVSSITLSNCGYGRSNCARDTVACARMPLLIWPTNELATCVRRLLVCCAAGCQLQKSNPGRAYFTSASRDSKCLCGQH
jgi:hypothetical protein